MNTFGADAGEDVTDWGEVNMEEKRLAAQSWRPIGSAPRDGTRILVWRPREDSVHEAHAGIDKWKNNCWYSSRPGQKPTHWMPLPAAPQSS